MNQPASLTGDPVRPVPRAAAPRAQALIDGPITATLARFALPLLVTNLLQMVTTTSAAIWVSHVLGANALTAVVIANIFAQIMIGAANGLGAACGVAVGQSVGSGDLQSVRRVAGTSMSFVVGLALVVAVLGIVLSPHIIAVMGTPEPARDMANTYLRWTCATLPSQFAFVVMLVMLRNTGDARTPFLFTFLWIALALVLAPVLLTGAFGAPNLGIAGLAIGNLLANTIALAAMITYVYLARLPLALLGADLRLLIPDPALLATLVRRGLPTALETFIVHGAYFTLLAVVNAQGAATAAAYSGAAQLWGYVQVPSNALSASMTAMAAINIGAGRWDRVNRITLRGTLLSVGCSATATFIILALGANLLALFIPDGGEVLAIAKTINQTALWGWIFLSVSMGVFAVVRANGEMLAPALTFGFTMWFLRIPFAIWMQPLLGVSAIWWSLPFGSISSAALSYAYFRWGGWRRRGLLVGKPS